MEPEDPFLCSQEPSTGPYPEPDNCSPRPPLLCHSSPFYRHVYKPDANSQY